MDIFLAILSQANRYKNMNYPFMKMTYDLRYNQGILYRLS